MLKLIAVAIDLWWRTVVMKNGWRGGLMVASAVLILMGCTPCW